MKIGFRSIVFVKSAIANGYLIALKAVVPSIKISSKIIGIEGNVLSVEIDGFIKFSF